jgi:hypothetical protein
MKPIGNAVRGFNPTTQPADFAGESRGLLVKRTNIRNHSGNQIARVFTISTLLRLSHMQIFLLLPVNGPLPSSVHLRVCLNVAIAFGHAQRANASPSPH